MISFNSKKIQAGLISDKEFAWYFNLNQNVENFFC